jgi:hypothetical protein
MTEKDLQLLEAVRKDQLDVIERLLNSKECDVNAKDADGCAAITHIVSVECMQLLVKHGADVDAVDTDGESLLRRSAHFSQNILLKAMLLAGADVEFRSPKGYATLHRAAYNTRVDSVRTLLAFGANPNVECLLEGKTPLELIDPPRTSSMTIPLLLAAGAQTRSTVYRVDDYVEEVALARREIAIERFQLIRARMLQICIGMQSLDLPALLTVAVIDEAIALAPLVEFHFKWDSVVAVKHFPQRK